MGDEPIHVGASALPQNLMALLRDALLAATAWGIGKGYIDQVTGTQIVGVGLAIATIAWRQFVTYRVHQKLVTTANASPNTVAIVK